MAEYWWLVPVAYIVGSAPWGLLIVRAVRGVDVREYGSGKTGVTNVFRTAGRRAAIVVLAADAGKGLGAVLLARALTPGEGVHAAVAAAVVVGHVWPVFAGFRGGRGVATGCGAFIAVAPLAALAILVAGAGVLAATRYVSVMSIAGTAAGFIAIVVLVIGGWLAPQYLLFGAAVALSIELSHLPNMRRLLRGVEPKLGQGGTRRAEGV
ncbi:MAG: glycerol-3-phosphate acyltransferase [Chloroflexi bacterium]|nr:glycerol-3-phosphate acyltransferase [Chloroflexota bacterium]